MTDWPYITAKFLVNKYEEAQKYYKLAKEGLEQVERSVVEVMGKEVLEDWRKQHKEWEEKVVDQKEHKDLKNPYAIEVTKRACGLRRWWEGKLTF